MQSVKLECSKHDATCAVVGWGGDDRVALTAVSSVWGRGKGKRPCADVLTSGNINILLRSVYGMSTCRGATRVSRNSVGITGIWALFAVNATLLLPAFGSCLVSRPAGEMYRRQVEGQKFERVAKDRPEWCCLLYTSDAADE